jgi:hypothetical protein
MSNVNTLINILASDSRKGLLDDKHAATRIAIWRKALQPHADIVGRNPIVRKYELVAACEVVDLHYWLDKHGIKHNGACNVFNQLTAVVSGRIPKDEAAKVVTKMVLHPAFVGAMKDFQTDQASKVLVGQLKYSILNELQRNPVKTAKKALDLLGLTPMFDAALACTGCNPSTK